MFGFQVGILDDEFPLLVEIVGSSNCIPILNTEQLLPTSFGNGIDSTKLSLSAEPWTFNLNPSFSEEQGILIHTTPSSTILDYE